MDRPPRLAHLSALDGLRGIAVLGVIAFHAGYLTGGYLGVDAFFVLSGFLITSLLLVEHHGTGTVSLGRFWQRRARRLLPALGLLLVVVVGSALLWATAEQARR
ncbi:MAG: acyltransferase, partial [Acidimicrobiales bacterium]|nr:acyltransferase [Acidimicrobiales bacterium]